MKSKKITNEYFAGLIDGEGYIGILRAKYYLHKVSQGYRYFVPVITIGNIYRPIIKVLDEGLRKGMQKRYSYSCPNSKPAWSWVQKGNKGVKEVLDKVKNSLIIKKRIAELVYDCCIATDIEKKKKLYLKCRKLNKRGVAETK